MGFNNHVQSFTPPFYLVVDNPFTRKKASLQGTKLAWLRSASYTGLWLMATQGTVQGQMKERKLAVGQVSCREIAGLEDWLSSCVRQVEVRLMVGT